MKTKVIGFIICIIMVLSMLTVMVSATDIISAPEHFGVKHYQGDHFNYTFSASEDLRSIIDQFDPAKAFVIAGQLDYKLGDGEWQYTSDWDSAKMSLKNTLSFHYARNATYLSETRASLSAMFPEDTAALQSVRDSGWDFPKTALSFRVRFVTSLDGNKTYIYSAWSDTYVYSKDVVKNPDVLINHKPVLTTTTIEKNTAGMPFLKIRTGRLPGQAQDLNAMVASGMHTEIWMRKAGEKDFKMINTSPFRNEYIMIGVTEYFEKAKASYEEEGYEIKIRYVLNDLRKYPQVGRSDIIYSPFSDVYSHNMPAWADASKWAATELTEADKLGLIPDILQGADMTKPITREEFAELAVLLYEKTTNEKSTPVSPNPFSDTTNPQILKAFKLGITTGTSATTFSPEVLINREQCAAMLFRTIQAMEPNGNYSVEGVKDFPDQKDIAKYAIPATKYMSSIGIVTGNGQGNFMPKAITTAQKAASYGMATREQAIAMSLRTYKK